MCRQIVSLNFLLVSSIVNHCISFLGPSSVTEDLIFFNLPSWRTDFSVSILCLKWTRTPKNVTRKVSSDTDQDVASVTVSFGHSKDFSVRKVRNGKNVYYHSWLSAASANFCPSENWILFLTELQKAIGFWFESFSLKFHHRQIGICDSALAIYKFISTTKYQVLKQKESNRDISFQIQDSFGQCSFRILSGIVFLQAGRFLTCFSKLPLENFAFSVLENLDIWFSANSIQFFASLFFFRKNPAQLPSFNLRFFIVWEDVIVYPELIPPWWHWPWPKRDSSTRPLC